MADQSESRLIATFENLAIRNEAKSKEANRPIYDDAVVCRIRLGGDRLQQPVFMAWEQVPGGVEDENGYMVPMTYAEKYKTQYDQFMAGEVQSKSGTPIEALTFLSVGKVKELKSLNIYTAESLASLEGASLKSLGVGGLEWKTKAQAFISSASGNAVVSKLADENAALRQQIEDMKRGAHPGPAPDVAEDHYNASDARVDEWSDYSDDELKGLIRDQTGSLPRGNPKRETLLSMVKELA